MSNASAASPSHFPIDFDVCYWADSFTTKPSKKHSSPWLIKRSTFGMSLTLPRKSLNATLFLVVLIFHFFRFFTSSRLFSSSMHLDSWGTCGKKTPVPLQNLNARQFRPAGCILARSGVDGQLRNSSLSHPYVYILLVCWSFSSCFLLFISPPVCAGLYVNFLYITLVLQRLIVL